MTDKEEISIVTNRQEILALAGLDLYNSELEEKLALYKEENKLRKAWTIQDLDIYLRKKVSTSIVTNEYMVDTNNTNRKIRKKTDKELISYLAQELSLEIMAIKHIYHHIKGQLELTSGKEDAKDFVSAQIYSVIDDLDIHIAHSETEKDRQGWYKLKMEAMDRLAKIENLEDKGVTNNTLIKGNVNSSTTIEKQVVISESQALAGLLSKILPRRTDT